jgi:hypothetical protein
VKTKLTGKDLYSVKISDGAVTECNYESCAKVVNKSNNSILCDNVK